jgi:hypothetical protein
MKTLIAAAIISIGAFSAAQAMPVAPAPADGAVTLIAQGCGPGMHRGPLGRCRPNGEPIIRPCPPGFHRNAIGRCRPN